MNTPQSERARSRHPHRIWSLLLICAMLAVQLATPTASFAASPVAVNDAATTPEDIAVTITVRNNDYDPDGDALTVTYASAGAQGGTTTVNANGTIRYAPPANFFGTDSFTYSISDGRGGTATATVTVTVTSVNDAPRAFPDSATTNEDTAVTISVLGNDRDVDGDPLTITSVTQGANGTAAVNANGTVTYTPRANWSRTDTFTYTISDGKGGKGSAEVTITVNPVNDAPDAVNDSYTTPEDTQLGWPLRAYSATTAIRTVIR